VRYVIDARRAGAKPSGIGTYIRAVGERLADQTDEPVRFWVPAHAPPISTRPNVTHHVQTSGTASIGMLLWPSLLDRLEPDDVFHATANILGYGLPRRSIVTLHDVIWLEHPEWCQPNPWLLPFSRRYFSVGIRHGIDAALRIITVSHAAADTILRTAPQVKDRLVVIPLAADPDFRPPASREASQARAAELLGFSEPYFLVVGQNQPSKGHSFALSAFARAELKGHRLVFVQRLRHGHGLHKQAQALGVADSVSFVGAKTRDELICLMQAATALVQPSLAEGFGLPTLEAMASGCPVIASAIGPIVEVVGSAGSLVEAAEAEPLKYSMRRLAQQASYRDELRARGLERARAFSWERTAEQTLAVYRDVSSAS
jgi:glycosyltransferase involved in cell wall biosynthesis